MYFHPMRSTDGILKISLWCVNIKSYKITIVEQDSLRGAICAKNISR